MEKDEAIFIGVRDPVELRKDILESSKAVVTSLKAFQERKRIHEEKLTEMAKLKGVGKELQRLTAQLRIHLPTAKLSSIIEQKRKIESLLPHEQPKPVKKPVKKVDRPKPRPAQPTKPKSELDKLEIELTDIESKLRGLR
ncbi:MAG: hypothetical protein KJ709_06380 [Nanoarchaeota archaeon]|nr:hypothetical protein [Nanoarchaeota archaeon]